MHVVKLVWAGLFVLLAQAMAPAAWSAGLTYPALYGSWQVTGLAVQDTPQGIQALVDNDPQYMGAVISFQPDKIVWLKGTKTRPVDPQIDNCPQTPVLTPADHNSGVDGGPVPGGQNIMCGTDLWGIVVRLSADRIKIYYLDNGILSLSREK
jgi:hypothetical protein